MAANASSSKGKGSGSGGPSAPPANKTAYRTATVEDDDEDDDDLDDLDDVLSSFNAPAKPAGKLPVDSAGISTAATAGSTRANSTAPDLADGDGEEFEANLIEGMENLLRSLASDNPPGVMPDKTASPAKGGAPPPALSSKEEEEAFQKAVQMMLSGEGMEALGLDAKTGGPAGGNRARAARSPGPSAAGPSSGKAKDTFEETIRKTMDSINSGGAGAATDGMPADIAALLQQLQSDPTALDGLADDDDELGGLLDNMMQQLMSKEVLEEPMNELAAKYPEYLAKPPADVSQTDLEKYRKQHELVKQIIAVFKRPGYTDDKDGKEVARLVGEMQDLGGPPNEIMGDLPEGFDMAGLGGEEGCIVM